MTTTTGIETIITVRRLAGQPTWDVLVNGRKGMSSPNPDAAASAAIAAVGANGGRAVVEYVDNNSMQDRARRKRLGQKTANEITEGDRFRVRFSPHHNAYVPCSDRAPTCESFTVYAVEFEDRHGQYVFRAADGVTTRRTRPFMPHEIIQLTTEE